MATSLVPAYPIQLPKGTWDSHVHVIDEVRPADDATQVDPSDPLTNA